MVALESASLGLQTGLQVRNKMIEAYKEIMAMPL
jgi:flagellar hook-basal body complex protein FliE